MQQKKIITGVLTLVLGALTSAAHAGPVICAVGGTINSGGPGFGTLTETFDQSGLSANYTCGVDDFDTATAASHTVTFAGFEWFSESGSTSASVTYDLGSAQTIDGLALWNEESSGIGVLDLFGSLDGINFFSLAAGLMPTDNPFDLDYFAEVFDFSATLLQYVRLDMSECPQEPSTFAACAIGEVAFRGADMVVPEPGILALLGIGMVGGFFARRRA